jgi:hypothetical protein
MPFPQARMTREFLLLIGVFAAIVVGDRSSAATPCRKPAC